jgi:hypothetical protein
VSRVWGSTSVVVPLIMVPLAPPAADAHRVWKKPEARVMIVIEDERLADPGFLVHTDLGRVRKLLNTASSPAARLATAVYRASADLHCDADAWVRRQLLALDAARFGDLELSARIAAVPVENEPDTQWSFQWATGSQVTPEFGATGL